jgi:hypothetical protein
VVGRGKLCPQGPRANFSSFHNGKQDKEIDKTKGEGTSEQTVHKLGQISLTTICCSNLLPNKRLKTNVQVKICEQNKANQ